MNFTWTIKPFHELSLDEFHDMIALRIDTFILEQEAPYQDLDGNDKVSYHIFGKNKQEEIIATARIIPAGIKYQEVSFGRVTSALSHRKQKAGLEMMEKIMAFIKSTFGDVPVRISAQTYLLNFYGKFGFESTGKEYLEDNLPHVEMLYKPKN